MVVCETVDQLLEACTGKNKDKIVVAWHLPVGDSGATQIAESLKTNTCLKKLTLFACNIGHKGGMELAEALEVNKTLEVFDYCDNNIGDQANRVLRDVWIKTRCQWNNNIQCSGGTWGTPVFVSKSPAIVVNEPHSKDESQFKWAKSLLLENMGKGKRRY